MSILPDAGKRGRFKLLTGEVLPAGPGQDGEAEGAEHLFPHVNMEARAGH
jgi:hypothetical protein